MSEAGGADNGGGQKPPSLWLVLALPVSLAISVFALGFGLLSALALEESGEATPTPTETTTTEPSAAAEGEEIWVNQGCGGCHTLSAAGATGAVGPNLDETTLSEEEIAAIVAEGRNQMPAFSSSLAEAEIAAVSAYVVASAETARSP